MTSWSQWTPQQNILLSIQDALQEALVPDNEIQRQVQEKILFLQKCTQKEFTNYLLFIIGNAIFSEDIRSLAAILLKNNLDLIYETQSEENINKSQLECLRLLKDPLREVRCSISNVVVAIAKVRLNEWPELIPFLINAFASQDEFSELALSTMFKICEDLVTSRKSDDHIQSVLKEVLPKFIDYLTQEECNVRFDIIRLTNQFLQDYFMVMKECIDLKKYLMIIIAYTSSDDIELLKQICHTFVIYVDNQEEAMLPHLQDVIVYLLEKSQHEDEEVALQASEFWLSLTKLKTCKEILLPYINKLLPILLKNMQYSQTELQVICGTLGNDAAIIDHPKDISPFHSRNKASGDHLRFEEDDDEGNEDVDDFYMGWTLRKCSAASLDSMAIHFGQGLLNPLVPYLNDIIHNEDHLVKESAILALGAIAEGCQTGLAPHLPYLVNFLINSMSDEHSLVRVITCWTLSRYVNWIVHSDSTPDTYFLPVMTILLKHFVDNNKRVQRAALSAFCIFEEEAQSKLVPYIDIILEGFQMGFQKYQSRSLYLLYDAIGVLAQSVGSQLSKEEYVGRLMPPLMQKFVGCKNYYDDQFLAVLECLSNLIPALESSFLPYSEVVYWHCLQLINHTLTFASKYEENSEEYDPPDKEPMHVAHDVLYSMALGLKVQFVKYVTNSNLLQLLQKTMQDSLYLVRQTSVALYGELVALCYPYLSTNINDYIPLIVANLDDKHDGVCNNAAWVIGKLCSFMGDNIRPYLPDILNAFVSILRSPVVPRTMHKTVAISLCIVFYICPDANVNEMDVIVRNCCMLIRNVRDSDEKDLAFRGLCKIVLLYPEFSKSNFIFFCDAVASWNNIRADLKEIVQNVLIIYKAQLGEENWKLFYEQFPDLLKSSLNSLYGL